MNKPFLIIFCLQVLYLPCFAQDTYNIIINGKPSITAKVTANSCRLSSEPQSSKLFIANEVSTKWPGISFKPVQGTWDLRRKRFIKADIVNKGSQELQVFLRADSQNKKLTSSVKIPANSKRTLNLDLTGTPWTMTEELKLNGLFVYPKKSTLKLAAVRSMTIFLNQPKTAAKFTIDNIRIEGKATLLDNKTFFPFIDSYGQFIHDNWPGKIHSNTDLKSSIKSEEIELNKRPGIKGWNNFGGWESGPQLEATGRFRVTKHQGKWSLVDPKGHLFWSNGITCISTKVSTGISHRQNYFKNLPKKGHPLSRFYKNHWWATKGFYKDKKPYTTFNFLTSNLMKKYGSEWQEKFNSKTHRRLRSWGINTMGNWSSKDIIAQQKTVYTATVHIGTPTISASSGYWGKFHDVFNPDFRSNVAKALLRAKYSFDDPWCLGIFVDNELAWGEELTLAKATLKSLPEQAAKKEFVADLRKKYNDINQLNKSWKSHYSSWQNILQQQTDAPENAKEDLALFAQKIATTYFKTIKQELKKLSPDSLYLGSRFAEVNDYAATAAAKYCDIVSYNKYSPSVSDHLLPKGLDRPMIIGEFHFGAQDRGVFNTGLQSATDQTHRAELYRQYILGAAVNPQIVGAHWFQYCDQPTTGRVDGENYQIGFISITDTPYPEIIKASQQTSEQLYKWRYNKK